MWHSKKKNYNFNGGFSVAFNYFSFSLKMKKKNTLNYIFPKNKENSPICINFLKYSNLKLYFRQITGIFRAVKKLL